MSSSAERLTSLEPGMPVLSPTGDVFRVSDTLAAAFKSGDTLVANPLAGLLHVPAEISAVVGDAMQAAAQAFADMSAVSDEQIVGFFRDAAANLEDDSVWAAIGDTNKQDVENARARGRSVTRLEVSQSMRDGMISGLLGWADMASRRDAVLESVEHDDFVIDLIGAALGPVGFVFEGRPNVLADACGVLRGGNTVVFRIGSDALQTAQTIMRKAITPALAANGLPVGAVVLIDSAEHSAGWSLFLDDRLALAVARGSGWAVDLLGSLAQSVGTPVSLHGTGGGWLVAGETAYAAHFQAAVIRSLDRKVCNTMNVCAIPASRAAELVPIMLAGLEAAAVNRGYAYKLHVTPAAKEFVPDALFERLVGIARAEGVIEEPQVELIEESGIGAEWEWEDSPEVTLAVFDNLNDCMAAFNQYSPRLVTTLLAQDSCEHTAFYAGVDAPFVGDDHTRWVDGQFALNKPELGLSNWANGRLFGRGAVLTGDSVYTVRTRYTAKR